MTVQACRYDRSLVFAGTTGDRELVERLRRGDESAFEELVDAYSPSLLRVALTHVPSRAVAEEVVQETWIAVLSSIDRFEGRSSLKTWIFTILVNTARTRGTRERRMLPFSFLRRRGAEDGGEEPAVAPERFLGDEHGDRAGWWASPPARWSEPAAQLESAETRMVIDAAIRELPLRQRQVISLRDVEGWSAAEVEATLALTESNQRVLLHRARSKVRGVLEEYLSTSGTRT
jgi:RNA polymerase sigma-70 factor (ECF subfamily)